jgi:two-component system, LytTR family, sensor kinase
MSWLSRTIMHRNAVNDQKTSTLSGRLVLLLFCLLTVMGAVRGLQHFYVVDAFEPVQFGLNWHIPFNIFVWWIWLAFIPLIRRVVVGRQADGHRFRTWFLVYLALPIGIIIVRQSISALVISSVLVGYRDFFPLLAARMLSNVWLWLDVLVYYVIVGGIQMLEYRRREQLSERRFAQLQTELNRSQLSALESQLHPHFLFNTLNTISTLILKADTLGAERMLSLLQEFLRRTLHGDERHQVTLAEEMRFVNQYLEIEKVRFQDRMEVEEAVSADTLTAVVPAFLLQPIVENAVLHGVASSVSRGTVRISSSRQGNRLTLLVEDNGPGLFHAHPAGHKKREGVGLKITRERLAHMFGRDHFLSIENALHGGVQVTIGIPFREAGHAVSVRAEGMEDRTPQHT